MCELGFKMWDLGSSVSGLGALGGWTKCCMSLGVTNDHHTLAKGV